jgi:hypothetical protein
MLKADASSEAGAPPSKEMIGRMGVFIEEVTKAGVMRSRRTQRSWRRSHAIQLPERALAGGVAEVRLPARGEAVHLPDHSLQRDLPG